MLELKAIREITALTEGKMLGKGDADLEIVREQVRLVGTNGTATEIEEMDEKDFVDMLMSLIIHHLAIMAITPPKSCRETLLNIHVDTLSYLKVYVEQQASRLRKSQAKVQILETILEKE